MLQKCSSAASSGGLKSVDAAQKINAWHCCPILVSACSCLTIKVLTSHIHWLTVLFNQMNLTGFWNVLFLHEKGFWNDHLKCKVHIYFDACPAMPHAIVFRENSRTCRKIQRNLLCFKESFSRFKYGYPSPGLFAHDASNMLCIMQKAFFFANT